MQLNSNVVPLNGEATSENSEPEATDLKAALNALINEPNIATRLKDDKLSEISRKVITEYEIDDNSRSEWKARMEGAMDLAMLVSGPDKTYPFEKASNVKYPLLTTAALQFQARAYPAIVPGDRIVKCKVNGRDPQGEKADRGERVSEFTSWQLTEEMPEWEPDTDKLLVILPIVGCVFRKKYWDPALGRQVSRLVTADRLVVNYRARSLEDVPRITEEMTLYPYEIGERIADGRFKAFEYNQSQADTRDKPEDQQQDADDPDTPHLFLEQHRLLDLDGDGYPEPYIVTVHHGSQQVCRIVANFTEHTVRMNQEGTKVVAIRKRDFYVKYGFLPSPDGGFYELGFGWLLKDNNEAINSNLNMMLDAGHVANVQGGIVSSALGIKEKSIRLKMGEWRVLNTSAPLNQAVMPITYPGPSETLFKLLGLLVEMGKEVASIKDVLSGETKTNMQPTTVLALIDQGMQFFTAIYKRIHRSLKAELQIHQRLNEEHLSLETYNGFFDDEQQYDPQLDFADDMGISPISDPTVSSKMQALARAEFIQNVWKEHPNIISEAEVVQRMLQAGSIEDGAKLITPPQPPDPLMQMLGELEAQDKMAGITEKLTNALKNVALAEAAEDGSQLDYYEQFVQALQPGGMDGQSGAQGALPPPPEPTAGTAGADSLPIPAPVPEAPLPVVSPEDQQLKSLSVEAAQLKNEGLKIANRSAEADIAAKDVTVKPDGSMQSKSETGFQAMTEMFGQLAQLIQQNGESTLAAVQQGNETLARIMMAPTVVTSRDAEGRAQAAQKVIN